MTKIDDYKVLTFDCYGTLIDWETGIWDAMQPVVRSNNRTDIIRSTGLAEFAKLETRQQSKTPSLLYPDVLTLVHTQFADSFNLTNSKDLDDNFGQSVPHWPAFADSADALRLLQKHFKLVILSNVNRDGFTASNKKLGVNFDAVYTAQDVGSYKPNPQNFDYLLTHIKSDFNLKPEEILHTAQSLHHDHVPATRAGLATAWIDRQGLAHSENWGATAVVEERPECNFTFATLMDMAEQLD